jgi:hypothetical protein
MTSVSEVIGAAPRGLNISAFFCSAISGYPIVIPNEVRDLLFRDTYFLIAFTRHFDPSVEFRLSQVK